MTVKMPLKIILFSRLCLLSTLFIMMKAEPVEDKQALIDFLHNISHTRPLNWDTRSSVCTNWVGITCNHNKSRVIAVQLPGFGLRGPIPSNTLSRLSDLQILSLRSNDISGPFPSEISQLRNLNNLNLQSNKFSGPLPSDFSAFRNLSILILSQNAFNGTIPCSISNLTQLIALNLSNNFHSGDIPDLNLPKLQVLDLSHNNLTGLVPKSLQRFPSSAFSSNNNISTENFPHPILPNPQPPKKRSKLTEPAILGIAIGTSALCFVLIAVTIMFCCSHKKGKKEEMPRSKEKPGKKPMSERKNHEDGSLVFFEGHNLVFDLEDLLRASAEMLGKGAFGITYKAALEDATTVVVKRVKDASMAKRVFEQQMEIAGNMRHENIAPLRAYYYSKEEKLMVYDHYAQGSVLSMLHGTRGNQVTLDWEARVRIAMGAARGLAHIHSSENGHNKLVHGNIKSSNIFLNSTQYGCISDFGLATIMNPTSTHVVRGEGYRAPEVTDNRKASQASDVYSFGVFLLELLTGKSSGGEEDAVNLVRWVHSVVREEWTAEVFDVELLKCPNIDEEIVEMLQIGMACAARMPEQRPKMADVLKRIEDLRRREIMSEDSTPPLTPPPPPVVEVGSTSRS
ncbi:probable inactive receptor kinase At5g53320 [Impatiens glandulifera]|uniref:probable inactive receptor kinase At5g53320 n=1 Tax=Impatiens glandulifera TaxID=253017 RepID=UPI001FB19DF6|nr:probable inactive receptor kinase At5g53320 [Impatiens glandulifera]